MKTIVFPAFPAFASIVAMCVAGCVGIDSSVRSDGMPAKGFCAHRGDRLRARENTPEAVREAIRHGAKMVEFDIRRCKTGELIVCHDLKVWAGRDETDLVSELPFARLRELGYATPEEMLAEIPKEGVWINLHCQYADKRCVAEELVHIIKSQGRLHQAIFSDYPARLDEARAVVPGIHCCDMERGVPWGREWTQTDVDRYIDNAISNKCDFIQFIRPVTAADVKRCHDNGITVNYFMEDDPAKQQALFDLGVDFILTNHLNPGWKLVFEEEFAGPALDTTKWSRIPSTRDAKKTPDWNRYTSDLPDLVEFKDGAIGLVGRVNTATNDDPRPYVQAQIWSKGKFSFTRGRIEIRAKFEDAKGAWPAFWLLPENRRWPDGGEIDVMERLNADPFAYFTAHNRWTVDLKKGATPKQGGKAPIVNGAYNVYAVEWTKNELVWTVNGEPVHRYPNVGLHPEQFPWNSPNYVLLDQQLGGGWVGEIDPATLPVRVWIDWVRVYQFDD